MQTIEATRQHCESYNGSELKPFLTPAGEEYARLHPRVALPPPPSARNYMAGLGRWISQVGFAQQMAGEPAYGYANNNPMTYFDPDGRGPQRRGGKPAQPQIGVGGSGNTCPGAAAVDIIRRRLSNNTTCRLTFEVTCGSRTLDDIVKQIQFEIGEPDCGSGAPACTRFKPGHDPFDKPGPCDPKSICISAAECKKGSSQIANNLIFEIGNWCGCKYHQAKNEQPAVSLCRACGYNEKQCKAGTIPGAKKTE